jgi:hypothetical protein
MGFAIIVFLVAGGAGLWLKFQGAAQSMADRRNAATRAQKQQERPKPAPEGHHTTGDLRTGQRSKREFGRRQV